MTSLRGKNFDRLGPSKIGVTIIIDTAIARVHLYAPYHLESHAYIRVLYYPQVVSNYKLTKRLRHDFLYFGIKAM